MFPTQQTFIEDLMGERHDAGRRGQRGSLTLTVYSFNFPRGHIDGYRSDPNVY